MYLRRFCKALDHKDVRRLIEAARFAEQLGRPLTTTVTINPALLANSPTDVGRWVSSITNKLRIWCGRAGFGYFAIWVRENYEGEGREHLHLLLSVPECERPALEDALRRWLPGEEGVLHIGRAKFRRDRLGRRTNQALTYVLKQMTPQAWFFLNKSVRRELRCRHTGERVAPVMGKRCGVSRSLEEKARKAFRAGEASLGVDARAAPLKGTSPQAA